MSPLELASRLIACPSVTPATGAVFDALEGMLRPLGFNVLRTLGGFREFGKSELFPRSWPVTPRGDALGSLGSGPEGQRAHPVIPRSKNEIGIARQAIAHRLVHKVLAPASGAASRIPLKTAKPSSVW